MGPSDRALDQIANALDRLVSLGLERLRLDAQDRADMLATNAAIRAATEDQQRLRDEQRAHLKECARAFHEQAREETLQ